MPTASTNPTSTTITSNSSSSSSNSVSNSAVTSNSNVVGASSQSFANTQQPVTFCTLVLPGNCTSNSPVCGILQNGQQMTFNGSCDACNNSNVLLFTNGGCSGSSTTTTTNSSNINTSSQAGASLGASPAIIPSNIVSSNSTTTSAVTATPNMFVFPCTAARLPSCISDGVPVCGQTNTGDQRSYTDLCAACRNP
jgi:hypothetical protein